MNGVGAVEVTRRVVDGVLRPEQPDLVGDAVFPVVEEICNEQTKCDGPPGDRECPADECLGDNVVDCVGRRHDEGFEQDVPYLSGGAGRHFYDFVPLEGTFELGLGQFSQEDRRTDQKEGVLDLGSQSFKDLGCHWDTPFMNVRQTMSAA